MCLVPPSSDNCLRIYLARAHRPHVGFLARCRCCRDTDSTWWLPLRSLLSCLQLRRPNGDTGARGTPVSPGAVRGTPQPRRDLCRPPCKLTIGCRSAGRYLWCLLPQSDRTILTYDPTYLPLPMRSEINFMKFGRRYENPQIYLF